MGISETKVVQGICNWSKLCFTYVIYIFSHFFSNINIFSVTHSDWPWISTILEILNMSLLEIPFSIDTWSRSSHLEVFLIKSVVKICSKFTGENPCRSVILIKLQSNFIEIAFHDGCSPVNWPHIFRTPFPRSTSGWLLLFKAQNFRGMIFLRHFNFEGFF